MMKCQLHCLFGFRFLWKPEARQTEKVLMLTVSLAGSVGWMPLVSGYTLGMCRGSNVKDKLATAFQLESLILAQNERWRQA